jgi:hypothetical protein
MFAKMFPVFLAMAAFGQEAAVHEAEHAAVNIAETGCVLSRAKNGETITVQGEVRREPHDLGFDIQGCDLTVLLTFAGNPDNQVSGNELRRDGELRRFHKYTTSFYMGNRKNICIDCMKYGDVEAEITGKLEIASMPPGATKDLYGLLRDQSGKVIGTYGWGHPSPYVPYRLVILSVANVKARKLPPPQ